MGDVVVLDGEDWQLGVLPETGASLAFGRILVDGRWRDLLRPTRQPDLTRPAGCASHVLIPFSNRVRDGVLRFGGRTWQLRRNSPDGTAMHGTGYELAWEVADLSDTHVTCVLRSAAVIGANYPWSFEATVRYGIDGRRLTVDTSVTNTDDEPFPAGFGHHPYFQRGITAPAVGEVEVSIPADLAYPLHRALPTGPPVPVPPALDFRRPRRLDGESVDACLTGLRPGEPVRMTWPRSGVSAELHADPVFTHTVFYVPRGRRYFSVEPVTNANDGFSLLADGVDGHGVFVLEPGQTRHGRIELDVRVGDYPRMSTTNTRVASGGISPAPVAP